MFAGRAGRRNSVYGQGRATCLNKADIPRLQEAIATPLESLSTPTAGLFPEFEQLEAFAGNQLEQDFHNILTRHASLWSFDCESIDLIGRSIGM